MSDVLFDDLTRALASDIPRRQALKLMIGMTAQLIVFPKVAWAAGVCRSQTQCRDDNRCDPLLKCAGDSGDDIGRIFTCDYSNANCVSGRNRKCVLSRESFLFRCAEPKRFCLQLAENSVDCVECKKNSHCKERGKGECCERVCCEGDTLYCVDKTCRDCRSDGHCKAQGKAECCDHVCCEVCERCDEENLCSARCPEPGSSERTECCKKDGGTKFGMCCKPNCCGENGKCIEPKGKIMEYYSDHIIVEVQETEVGLGKISVHEVLNATVEIPPFEDGTTEPVHVIATKIDLNQRSLLLLKASPASDCGCDECSDIFDPVLTQIVIPKGTHQVTEVFERIPAKEHYLTLQNGAPGLRRVRILVNGIEAATRWLRDGSVRFLDIAEWMIEGENVITVVANGWPGTAALFIVSDVPTVENAATAAFADVPPIAWKPVAWRPGQDLHWGR